MKEKRREGRKKERRKGKREGKGEDYIFQFHQKEVKIDKLRNNIINLQIIWFKTLHFVTGYIGVLSLN